VIYWVRCILCTSLLAYEEKTPPAWLVFGASVPWRYVSPTHPYVLYIALLLRAVVFRSTALINPNNTVGISPLCVTQWQRPDRPSSFMQKDRLRTWLPNMRIKSARQQCVSRIHHIALGGQNTAGGIVFLVSSSKSAYLRAWVCRLSPGSVFFWGKNINNDVYKDPHCRPKCIMIAASNPGRGYPSAKRTLVSDVVVTCLKRNRPNREPGA